VHVITERHPDGYAIYYIPTATENLQ
jgi:hypothetical protein